MANHNMVTAIHIRLSLTLQKTINICVITKNDLGERDFDIQPLLIENSSSLPLTKESSRGFLLKKNETSARPYGHRA